MKKWVKIILVGLTLAILLVAGKQAFGYIYNEKLISEYNDEEYDMNTKPLFFANCFEPCVAYYNRGNICYKKENYEEAIDNYKMALEKNPGEVKECSIRINLALAMIYNMGEDYAQPEKIDQSIKILEEARDILLEKGCAADDGKGHSETAQKLKEEIDALIEKLKEEKESQENNQNNQNQNQNQNNAQGEQEDPDQELMEQLQQNQADAHQEREENLEQQESDNYNYNWNSNYDGIW